MGGEVGARLGVDGIGDDDPRPGGVPVGGGAQPGGDALDRAGDLGEAADMDDAIDVRGGLGVGDNEEAGDAGGRVGAGMAAAVLDGEGGADGGADERLLVGEDHFALGEPILAQPAEGHIGRGRGAGGDDADVLTAALLEGRAQELLRALGRYQAGGGSGRGVDPFADLVRHVEPGGVDECALGIGGAEVGIGGNGEGARMLGQHTIDVDGKAERRGVVRGRGKVADLHGRPSIGRGARGQRKRAGACASARFSKQ